MLITIILLIVSLGSTIWAFIERHSKGLLSKLIAELNINVDVLKADLGQAKSLLSIEKNLHAQEKAKSFDLQKKVDTLMTPAPEAKIVKPRKKRKS